MVNFRDGHPEEGFGIAIYMSSPFVSGFSQRERRIKGFLRWGSVWCEWGSPW